LKNYLTAITIGVIATLLSRAILTLSGLVTLTAFLSLLALALPRIPGLLTACPRWVLIALATLLALVAIVLRLLIATLVLIALLTTLSGPILIIAIVRHRRVSSIDAAISAPRAVDACI
jgi:hypothetical protein